MRRRAILRVMGILGCLLAGYLLSSCATSQGSTLRTVVSAETTQTQPPKPPSRNPPPDPGDKKGIEVVTDPDSAEVWIDGDFKGLSPLLVDDVGKGSHRIVVLKQGYYDTSTWVNLTGTYMLYEVNLVQIVGFLNVDVTPASSIIALNGNRIPSGLVQVPVGSYALKVRAFGYVDYETSVLIAENLVTNASIALSVAPFAVTDFSAPKTAVNPDNPGLLGTIDGYYSVSGPGTGRIEVSDSAGAIVYSRPLPDFTTWDNIFNWNASDNGGTKLADGAYTLSIIASGADGDSPVIRRIPISIDRTLKIAPRSLWSGSSGLLYAPVAEVLPPGDFQIELMGAGIATGDFSVFQAPVIMGVRAGLSGKMEIDASIGTVAVSTNLPLLASLSARWNLLSPSGEFGTSAAIQTKIAVQFFPALGVPLMTDTFANFTGISLELPLELSLGATSILFTAGATSSLWYPYRYSTGTTAEQSFATWLYLRGGVMFDLGSVMAGISGSTRTEALPGGIALLGTPVPFELGAEIHVLIPGTRLLLSGIMAGEFVDMANYYFMGGAGLGFLY